MRHLGAMACVVALVSVADAGTVLVKGELTFTPAGIGKISECERGRTFTLGLMPSTPYFQLVQRYWELSNHGKTAVLIEVRGDVTKTSSPESETTLQSPSVVALLAGTCSKASPDNALQQTPDG